MILTTEQAAYLAGVIDGEGWIGYERVGASIKNGTVSASYSARLTISNTGKEWLEVLGTWLPNARLEKTEGEASRNRRACYRLNWNGYNVQGVLAEVMPYLMLKKRQGECVLRGIELCLQRRLTSKNARPANPEIVAAQEAIYQEVRGLNKRGHIEAKSPGGVRIDRLCSVTGCDRPHYGRGYCWIHYRKYIVRGGPTAHQKTCATCGQGFVSKRSDALCCSKKCRDDHYYATNTEKVKAGARAYKQRKRNSDKDALLSAVDN